MLGWKLVSNDKMAWLLKSIWTQILCAYNAPELKFPGFRTELQLHTASSILISVLKKIAPMITPAIWNSIPGRHHCLFSYNPKQGISTKTNKNDISIK